MTDRSDFFRFRRYVLELDGVAQGAFEEFHPPATQLVDADVSGVQPVFRRRPLLLTHGVANTRELLDWISKAVEQRGARTAVVVELDDAGEPVRRHSFAGAWPVSVEFATLTTEETHFNVDLLSLATQSWTADEAGQAAATTPARER